MKHREKRLEYPHQYHTLSVKEWRKIAFFDKKKYNLDGLDGFQKYCHAKYFPEENYSARHSGEGSLMIWGGGGGGLSHIQENLNYNLSVVGNKQQIM